VSAHYALSRLVLPPPPPAPNTLPLPPITLPDVRSMFIGYHYSFSKLPDAPMPPRLADERIGFFTTDRLDFTSDVPRVPVTRYVNRWRLEKKDPAAALSEPKQPIVFWLDRNIPVKYRAAIAEGILEWNKAFERIGYKDAIKVEVQPDDADFDTSDIRHASVRWQTVAEDRVRRDRPVGSGPAHRRDPRRRHRLRREQRARRAQPEARVHHRAPDGKTAQLAEQMAAQLADPARGPSQARSIAYCAYDDVATQQASFGLSLLEARGDLDADSPDLDKFVNAFLKDVAMHEVGHTLGLRHNFRASTIYTEEQLRDPEFTQQNGIAGSVMEYNPWNISLKTEKQGEFQMSTLGPYDYWAIEYGYKEVDRAQESAELERIASRSSEPLLAYSTDEDVAYFAIDPAVNQGDLSSDPLGYAKKRLALVRELWQRHGEDAAAAGRELLGPAPQLHARAQRGGQGAVYAARYIGGPHHAARPRRQRRQPFQPVDVAKQRQALDLIATEIFSADSFSFSPSFLRKMTVSIFDMDDAEELGRPIPPLDFPVDQQLPDDAEERARRADEPDRRAAPPEQRGQDRRRAQRAQGVRPLHDAARGDLERAQDRPRHHAVPRNLQREHVLRVANALLRPSGSMPADARATLRADARALRADLAGRAEPFRLLAEAKAHVAEALTMIEEALKAPSSGRPPDTRGADGAARPAAKRTGPANAGPVSLVEPGSTLRGPSVPHDRHHRHPDPHPRPARQPRAVEPVRSLDANLRQIEAALDVAITAPGAEFSIAGAPASTAMRPTRCGASTPAPPSRCPSTTSSSGWSSRGPPRRAARPPAASTSPCCARGGPTCTAEPPTRSPTCARSRATTSRSGSARRAPARRTSPSPARSTRSSATRSGASCWCGPAVEAGERLGLPARRPRAEGRPVPAPLYDALYDLMGFDKVTKLFERSTIEIAPLAYMRGRTLNHSFIILDEAQNTTPEQMKMFLTRIGFGTRAVITGDVTQIDLARGQKSGLIDATACWPGVRGIGFVRFTSADVGAPSAGAEDHRRVRRRPARAPVRAKPRMADARARRRGLR
jgi:hypothetical protein